MDSAKERHVSASGAGGLWLAALSLAATIADPAQSMALDLWSVAGLSSRRAPVGRRALSDGLDSAARRSVVGRQRVQRERIHVVRQRAICGFILMIEQNRCCIHPRPEIVPWTSYSMTTRGRRRGVDDELVGGLSAMAST